MKKTLALAVDCFFLMRPVVLIPVWGFAAFGYWRGRNLSVAELPLLWATMPASLFPWILLFSLSVACVYVLNQIADREVDAKNPGMPLLARGVVSLRAAAAVAVITSLLSIIPPLSGGHRTVAALSGAAIAVGMLYSFRPTYFSGRIFLDFLTNAAGFGVIAFAVGWHFAGRPLFPELFRSALPYFLLMCGGSISSTIPDAAGDRAGRKLTTAVVLGPKRAHLLASVFIAGAAAAAFEMKDPVALICSAASLPIYLLQLFFPGKAIEEATYKIGGALCMAAAALIMPWLFVAGTAVFLATWVYFRFRHGVSYPSLVPGERPEKTEGGQSGT